jgi:PAS domain S-box-containing protein
MVNGPRAERPAGGGADATAAPLLPADGPSPSGSEGRPNTVEILHVEDSVLDADLAAVRLRAAGLACRVRRVETADEFAAALDEPGPLHLILSDYLLPSFDGMSALRMTRQRRPEVPFIFVSGVLGEENAIDSLKHGATDYVLKQRMERLGPAVHRALAEAGERAERRRIEAALRRSEQQLRYTLDAVRIGHWDLDLINGDIPHRSTSHDQIFGYDAPPAGWTFHTFLSRHVHPADRDRVERTFRQAVSDGTDWEVECRIRRADDVERWVWVKGGTYARGPDGSPLRMSGVVTDVTDRKQAEQERERLLRSEREARAAAEEARAAAETARATAEAARAEVERAGRLKDDFLATVSHELRTPLNAVLGWAQLLRRGVIPPHEVPDTVGVIERNAKLQAQLVEDLLDLSRIISGKLRLDVQDVDLPAVVRAAVTTVRPAVEAKGIRVAERLAADAGPVRGDPARLQQVLWNLLSNAAKFTPAGGSIDVTLEATPDASGVAVMVRDSGQGIDPAFVPHVFDRFRQQDGSSARKHGGLGVGLSIVRHLVELHGGTVAAASGGTGLGATFVVTLPVAGAARRLPADSDVNGGRTDQAGRTRPTRPDLCPPDLAGIRVLVLEDEDDTRAFMRRILEDCDAEVFDAPAAAEAFELLRRHRPDMILCDIGMPGEDGYQFIRRVRRLPTDEGGATPAVAVTAYARPEDRERALHAGFQLHLAKPVDATELVEVVATIVRPWGAAARPAGR